MVEPRRHVAGLADLTDEEAARIGVLVHRFSRSLQEIAGADHVYAFVFGDAVRHLHVHLAPRYPGAPDRLRGLGAVDIQRSPEVPRGGVDEIRALCDRLRS